MALLLKPEKNGSKDQFETKKEFIDKINMDNIKKELKEEIRRVKVELVMKDYLDGWSIKHYKKLLKKLENKLEDVNIIIKRRGR